MEELGVALEGRARADGSAELCVARADKTQPCFYEVVCRVMK